MSGFAADWLALREPLDARARAANLATFLVESCVAPRADGARLEIVDLGAGTGANLRYAAPLLGGAQDWVLVEHDPLLRAALAARMPDGTFRGEGFDCRVRCLALDLATQLDGLPLRDATLLTASAVLDLVSADWLGQLIGRAARALAPVWFALTYDGRSECHPAEPEDHEVRALVNRHQLGDKGFGAALGPAAARTAEQLLIEHGYRVRCVRSDWHIGTEHAALQFALLQGWFEAASQIAPQRTRALHDWLERRRAHVGGGRSQLRVGHVDMAGTLQSLSA